MTRTCVILLLGVSWGLGQARPRYAAADRVSAAEARNYVYVLASQPMEGRATPSRGLDAAALFVASKLDEWGLRPMGAPQDADPLRRFFLPIGLETLRPDLGHTRAEMSGTRFQYGRDFVGAGRMAGTARGQLVFVAAPYAAQTAVDVRGKIMVVAAGPAPQEYALAHGAAGIVVLPGLGQIISMLDPQAAGEMMALNSGGTISPAAAAASLGAAPMVVTRLQATGPAVPAIVAGPVLLNALFRGEKVGSTRIIASAALGTSGPAVASFALAPDKVLSFSLAAQAEASETEDVVAALPGSDPALASEYVVLSAHLDHLGAGFPGADDDGSGSAGLLAIAHAFAQGPRPGRSLLFVWHSGEEKGLWGSEFFTHFPPVPVGAIVADLNMDMIGRSKPAGDSNPKDAHLAEPGEVFVVGPEVSSDDLEQTLETVNRNYLKLRLNHYWDRTDDSDRIFYRSDHYNYALAGIPIVFFTDGLHLDYHQATDTPEKLDYGQLRAIAATAAALAQTLGDAPGRPGTKAWKKP